MELEEMAMERVKGMGRNGNGKGNEKKNKARDSDDFDDIYDEPEYPSDVPTIIVQNPESKITKITKIISPTMVKDLTVK
jgi:hypothetical protein